MRIGLKRDRHEFKINRLDMIETYKEKLRLAFKSQTADPPVSGMYILKGDVSGIQNFIFNIQSEGATRMLKARSFFIQISVQLCIEKIKLEFSQNKPKVLSDSGGSFYIQFDSKPESVKLDELKKKVNEQLATFGLFISMTIEPHNKWNDVMQLLKAKEETQKFQRYINSPEAFREFNIIKNKDEAKIWKDFAKELSLSKGYRIEETKEIVGIQENAVVLWNLKFQLEKGKPKVSFDDPQSSLMNYLPIWRIENPYWRAFENGLIEQENKLTENRKDKYNEPKINEIIDFDHLVIQSKVRTGTDNLGVLKLDVDNLGAMFRDVFTTRERYSNASDAFGYFFGKYIKDLWSHKTFTDIEGNPHHFRDNILIIYSGGDDCLLLGGWDAILEFAQMFRKEFKDFCSDLKYKEKDLSFSAAILLVQASTPVIQIGYLAETELEKAKLQPDKNAISLFGEVFNWEDFNKIKMLTTTLSDLIGGAYGKPPESKALLQKIRLSARGYDALMKKAEIKKQVNFQKVWNLTWFIMRNVKNENKKEVETKIVNEYHDAVLKALMSREYAKALIYPAAARWTELLTRKN